MYFFPWANYDSIHPGVQFQRYLATNPFCAGPLRDFFTDTACSFLIVEKLNVSDIVREGSVLACGSSIDQFGNEVNYYHPIHFSGSLKL